MSLNPPSDPTLAYYEAHAERFAADTLGADMSALYAPFLELVPPGGSILDAGCGAGRDALAFLRLGYAVTAFDASPAMAEIASRLSGLMVEALRFQEVAFGPVFDGVWACASLLHVPSSEMSDAVGRLANSLKPGGVLFASFKEGEGEVERGGRRFTNYTPTTLERGLVGQPALDVVRIWTTHDVRPGRSNETWVNALARKQLAEPTR
jgi:SAM-dependent methyltransferase